MFRQISGGACHRVLGIFLVLLFTLFLMPTQGLAVNFSISNVKIEASLLEDGDVKVTEQLTYEFDGEFNGITREVIPKKGAKITNFAATENEKFLKIEREDHLYKVHRKGSDETITIQLMYTIENGIDIYTDVIDFYWPFFDERNETTYQNLAIIIHPPSPTNDVIAFGYDEASETEKILKDGSVVYEFGEVPYGTNGDIRVAYDRELFPSASITSEKVMKNEIQREHQHLLDSAAAKIKMHDRLVSYGVPVIIVFALALFSLLTKTTISSRATLKAIQSENDQSFRLPAETMSIPETISFTHGYLPAEAMAAALLDLARKKIIKKSKNNGFRLVPREFSLLKHETILTELLFNEIGENGEFSFEDLKAYIKDKKNHQKYQLAISKWKQAVKEEIRYEKLYEKKMRYRFSVGYSSFLLVPLLILFPMYNLPIWFLVTLFLFAGTIIYAVSYHPKTNKGYRIKYEWELFKLNFHSLSPSHWNSLTENEQMRAYIYNLGTNNKGLVKKNEELVNAFKTPHSPSDTAVVGYYAPTDMSTIAFFGPISSSSFHSADKTTQSTTGASSAGGSGGGTGGGGGGSGAF
ncbi:DUF2207 domain-containing protein [Litchfieldia alkalitelluris]|uniref:DUF2207 domain-containing protein n=1 Tax=Litchfieldia alkalitelluris TaxID=304268 RepID=UPI00099899C1|nr:DUF2207 domain-containing protein [Litchfieldia alkalitelluris]